MSGSELARRHRLAERGVGNSREAILARRARERQRRIEAIERGDALPGWIKFGVGTNEMVSQYLSSLNPEARAKAVKLLHNLNQDTK